MIGPYQDAARHLVRRGVQASVSFQAAAAQNNGQQNGEHPQTPFNLPTHVIIILGLTAVVCSVFLTSIRYTLWGIVATLAQVESPSNQFVLKEEKAQDGKAQTGAEQPAEETVDAEVTVVKAKPLTASIRRTIRHLHARAGFASRWRALSMFIVYAVSHSLLAGFIANLLGAFHYPYYGTVFLAKSVGSVIATVALARFSTAWVHIVISVPSAEPWYKRVPGMRSWKNVWVGAAAVDLSFRLAYALPAGCAMALGLDPVTTHSEHPALIVFKVLVCVALGLLTVVSVVIPANVALVRVQASMLPEEDEAIVPFDRTFGGKVVPEILGGSGAIGFVDAWRTFDMSSRFRIVKMFFKFVGIEIALHLFFAAIAAVEILLMISPDHLRQMLAFV